MTEDTTAHDAHGLDPGAPASGERTVGRLLADRLRLLGVRRVFGEPLPGIDHVPVDDPDLAVLLADVDGRVGGDRGAGRLGAALLTGGILHLSSSPGGLAHPEPIGSAEELVDALDTRRGIGVPDTFALHLDLSLDEPVRDAIGSNVEPDRRVVVTLAPDLAGMRFLIVAGPGVVRTGSVHRLATLAGRLGAPVVNTFGAKGLFFWDDPHHGGTVGLQQRDWALAGVEEADLVILTGLDAAEVGPSTFAAAVTTEVEPTQLDAMVHHWPEGEPPEVRAGAVELHRLVTEVVRPLYDSFTPARAALHLAGALDTGGVCAADAGAAGFWVARALPTAQPGRVALPARPEPGFAAAAGIVAALDGRPHLCVIDQLDETTLALAELARALGVGVHLQQWVPGTPGDPADHVAMLEAAQHDPGVRIDTVELDLDAPGPLGEVAGELAIWT